METYAALAIDSAVKERARTPGLSSTGMLLALVLGAAAVAATFVILQAGMVVEAPAFERFGALAAAMAGLWAWCKHRSLDPRVGDAALIVAVGTLALMLCGVISNAGLRLGAVPVDAYLVRADALLGVNVVPAVRAFAGHPFAINALASVYNASGAAVVVLIVAALATGRRSTAWELVATVVVAMQVVALVSIALPAIGAMAHLDMLDLQGNGLPLGAGIYHLEAFRHFHAGHDPVLRLSDMSGLVTFPSFHTVLALLATQALAGTRLRWLGVAWTAAVIVSTIPIGGHYVTDLLAGFAIWAGCACLARRVSTPSA